MTLRGPKTARPPSTFTASSRHKAESICDAMGLREGWFALGYGHIAAKASDDPGRKSRIHCESHGEGLRQGPASFKSHIDPQTESAALPAIRMKRQSARSVNLPPWMWMRWLLIPRDHERWPTPMKVPWNLTTSSAARSLARLASLSLDDWLRRQPRNKDLCILISPIRTGPRARPEGM